MASIAHDERGQGASAPNAPEASTQPDLSYIADALRPLAVDVSQLVPDPANARKHDERNIAAIRSSLSRFGQRIPIVVQKQGMIVRAGNGRLQAAKLLGWTHIAAVIVDEASIDATAYAIADNRTAELAEWDNAVLAGLLEGLPKDVQLAAGFNNNELDELIKSISSSTTTDTDFHGVSMHDSFIVPPFSVLDTRLSAWQERREKWDAMGIDSSEGRTSPCLEVGDKIAEYMPQYASLVAQGGTSVFDPVLCELMYRWFCPVDGVVIDPFSGGSVRGIVAHKLGFKYWGCDIRHEQVAENDAQATSVFGSHSIEWLCCDAAVADPPDADFLFSCPPYGSLEKYSDDPKDISNMTPDEFLSTYRAIIKRFCDKLRNNRFACFVVGDYRQKGTTHYTNFVSQTIAAFEDAGLSLYNEAVLINAIGTLPIRASSSFKKSRKLGKMHQNVLVFVKGDFKLAMNNLEKLGEQPQPDQAEQE